MKRKLLYIVFFVLCMVLSNAFFGIVVKDSNPIKVQFKIAVESNYRGALQFFWDDGHGYTEINSKIINYRGEKNLIVEVPETIHYFRIDFGEETSEYILNKIAVEIGQRKVEYPLTSDFQINMVDIVYKNENIEILTNGNDPYMILDLDAIDFEYLVNTEKKGASSRMAILLSACFDFVLLVIFLFRKTIMTISCEIIMNRGLILDLAKNDFKTRYAGAYLGVAWAFVHPVVTILVYWFVFQVGFKSGIMNGVPFVLWLATGLIPWFFFNEAVNSSTASLVDYSYLVKKVVFNISIVPIVRILSALFVHLFFIGFIITLYIVNGFNPCIHWIQIVYYSVCMILFTLGISYLTSSLMVFFRDLAQIVAVILQIFIWLTPIMWNFEVIAPKLQWIFKLNPMFYIVEGYRSAMIDHEWFWNEPIQTVYIWLFILGSLFLGNKVFNKLKVHLADVL